MYLLVVRHDRCVTARGCAIYTKPYSNSTGTSVVLEVNKTESDTKRFCYWKQNHGELFLQCLFSYQIFTRRSFSPEVANKVPSGLKAKCWTGVAVAAFQTQCHAVCSCSINEYEYFKLFSITEWLSTRIRIQSSSSLFCLLQI